MMSFLFQHLLFLLGYAVLVWAVGETFLRGLGRWTGGLDLDLDGGVDGDGLSSMGERLPWALACGLGWTAQGLFFLGLAGLLSAGWMALFAGLALLLCRDALASLLQISIDLGRRARPAPGRAGAVTLGALGLGLPLIWPAFYPPISFDGGMYHLPFASRFLEAGRLVWMPEVRYPIFPQGAEMHFLPALAWLGDVAAKLTQTLPLFAVAVLLWREGRRFGSRRVGLWAAALWLGTPVVVRVGTQAYVDVSTALHVGAAFFAWFRWEEARKGAESRSVGTGRAGFWLALLGLQLGFAAAVKYSALFFVLAAGFAMLGSGLRLSPAHWKKTLLAATVAGLWFSLAAAPWYGRIALQTGNPVFPFYTQIFGDNPWRHSHDDRSLADRTADDSTGSGVLQAASDLVTVPWDSWFERDRFHRQAPLSPFFVVLVPWLLWPALASPLGRRILILSLAYGFFWTTTEQDLRILFPILPLLGLAAALALDRLGSRVGRLRRPAVVWLAAGLFVAPGWLFSVYQAQRLGPLPTDEAARHVFLARNLDGYTEMRRLETLHGDDFSVYVLYGEHLRHVCAGRMLGDWFGPERFERVLESASTAQGLHAELRSMDVGYFMVRRPWPTGELPRRDAAFATLFEAVDFEAMDFEAIDGEAVDTGPESPDPTLRRAFDLYRLRQPVEPAQR